MTISNSEDLLLDPPERVQKLFLQDDPFPLETVTGELALIERHRSDPAVASAIQRVQAQKSIVLGKVLSMASEYAVNRVAVERGDWLYAEGWIARALTALVWLAMYAADEFSIPDGNCEQRLRDFCREFSAEGELDLILDASDQRQQLESLISLCFQAVGHLRATEDKLSIGNEDELRVLHEDPNRIKFWPSHPATDEAKQANLDELEMVLSQMPGYVGTLLIGSFGDGALSVLRIYAARSYWAGHRRLYCFQKASQRSDLT